jgi:hypothetical protein
MAKKFIFSNIEVNNGSSTRSGSDTVAVVPFESWAPSGSNGTGYNMAVAVLTPQSHREQQPPPKKHKTKNPQVHNNKPTGSGTTGGSDTVAVVPFESWAPSGSNGTGYNMAVAVLTPQSHRKQQPPPQKHKTKNPQVHNNKPAGSGTTSGSGAVAVVPFESWAPSRSNDTGYNMAVAVLTPQSHRKQQPPPQKQKNKNPQVHNNKPAGSGTTSGSGAMTVAPFESWAQGGSNDTGYNMAVAVLTPQSHRQQQPPTGAHLERAHCVEHAKAELASVLRNLVKIPVFFMGFYR